jgi:hypothetical protein
LEPEVVFHILSDFSDKALEEHLADKELRGLLLLPDFLEGDVMSVSLFVIRQSKIYSVCLIPKFLMHRNR